MGGKKDNYDDFLDEEIQFPWQYINQYLYGQITFDDAIDKTIEEFNRLIKEHLEKCMAQK